MALLRGKIPDRAGEMAQQLRALAVLPENPGSIPSTHVAARLGDLASICRHIHVGKTPINAHENK